MAQRQFRTDDTSVWGDRYGNGTDGAYAPSTGTDAPIDSACTGTIGTTSLSATNASFSPGQLIMIHQTRGTGAGQWELNRIASYSAGTITTSYELIYGYVSGAQVLVMPQYSSGNIANGTTILGKSWNGTVGGIYAKFCNGTFTIAGTLSLNGNDGGVKTSDGTLAGAVGIGFEGGTAAVQSLNVTTTGEGTTGAKVTNQKTANGNAGGGGLSVASEANAGGGGGNGVAGNDGQEYTQGGKGGSTAGSASLVTMVFGGGGGGGGRPTAAYAGAGAAGAGICVIIAKEVIVTGTITATGGSAGALSGSGATPAGGGAGGGGSILIKGQRVTLGSSLVTASGGSINQTSPPSNPVWGGAGGAGRIHVDYSILLSGSTTPTLDSSTDTILNDLPSIENYTLLI